MKSDKPIWWPKNPYPESIFPMVCSEYEKIVPDLRERTALSGMLGREFWEIASETIWDRVKNELEEMNNASKKHITTLGFTIRTERALRNGGIETIEDLISMTPNKLLALRWFGKTSLREVQYKLKELNFSLIKDSNP